jgi:protoheme IX farnesyltransferase
MFKIYADLTKLGIVIFVVLTGLAGYAFSFPIEKTFDWSQLLLVLGGLYFLSSGSLALNQVQEWPLDQKMPRTAKRPIASGKIKPAAAAILAICFLAIGSDFLFRVSWMSGVLGLATVALYNGLYVYWWKPNWVFAAIPGAIPGALPVTIGYAANKMDILQPDSVYLFAILFFWQMPHFWALAIRFKDDYSKGSVPVLPSSIGMSRTLYHMGLWTFLYVGAAMAQPLFVQSNWTYIALVIPFSFKVMQEFYRFYKSEGTKRWLSFFMWVNLSVLVFLFVPVLDKWSFLFIGSN